MCATCIIHSVPWCAKRLYISPGDAEAAFFNVGRPILDFAKTSAGFFMCLSISSEINIIAIEREYLEVKKGLLLTDHIHKYLFLRQNNTQFIQSCTLI